MGPIGCTGGSSTERQINTSRSSTAERQIGCIGGPAHRFKHLTVSRYHNRSPRDGGLSAWKLEAVAECFAGWLQLGSNMNDSCFRKGAAGARSAVNRRLMRHARGVEIWWHGLLPRIN